MLQRFPSPSAEQLESGSHHSLLITLDHVTEEVKELGGDVGFWKAIRNEKNRISMGFLQEVGGLEDWFHIFVGLFSGSMLLRAGKYHQYCSENKFLPVCSQFQGSIYERSFLSS